MKVELAGVEAPDVVDQARFAPVLAHLDRSGPRDGSLSIMNGSGTVHVRSHPDRPENDELVFEWWGATSAPTGCT